MTPELDLPPPTPKRQARLDQIRADFLAGRDAGDPWANEDLGGC